ncbi:MAG: glycosyltransferase [Thermoplasmata archaeon]
MLYRILFQVANDDLSLNKVRKEFNIIANGLKSVKPLLQCLDHTVRNIDENEYTGRIFREESAVSDRKASIIVVTYNNIEYTKLCLESIISKTDYPNYEIIVVDNNSLDGTREYLQNIQKIISFIKVIFNNENTGFAKANNQGIQCASGDYIVFLNNDTVVTKGWLTKLIDYLDKYPEIGLIGPVTNSCGNEAKIDVPYKDLGEMDRFAYFYTSSHAGLFFDIKMLALYCAATRRKTIEDVGMLDERFSVGMFEDDDFSYRIKLKGYRVVCAEDIFVHHFGQASFKKLLQTGEYYKIFEQNKKLFESKWGIKWEPHYKSANPIISEVRHLRDQLNSLKSQLDQIIVEKENLSKQLKAIYSSYTWKVLSFYSQNLNNSFILRNIDKVLKILLNTFVKVINLIIHLKKHGFIPTIKVINDNLKSKTKMLLKAKKYKKISIDEILDGKNTKGIVVYPPTIDWSHTLFQRPHHIMKRLASKGFIVFFCTPNQVDALSSDLVAVDENLYLCKNINVLSVLSGRSDLVLYVSNTMHKPLIEKLRPSKVVYDYIDELEVFSNYDAEMAETHRKLLAESDLVLATADNLWREVQQFRKDVVLCPNGVDYWHFAKAQLPGQVPYDFEKKGLTSRPIIGYYGALAEWFDYDLIIKAAKNRPNYNFVLIGLDYDGSLSKSGIISLPNVHYFGPKKYDELPLYLRYFDVAIIPFKLNKITHSTSPIKLFEYMAALKPIVATAMQEIKKYSNVLIAENQDEFVQLIDKAFKLKSDTAYLENIRQEALKNTWDRRVDLIIRWIKQPNFQRALIEHVNKKISFNHPMRDTYIEFASSTVERGDEVVKILSNYTEIKGKSYLDIGCAYGGFPVAFAQAGASEVIGIDIDEDLLKLAYELLKDYNSPTQPKFISCDILKCDEKNFGKFDIITCNDVIEHVSSPELLVEKLSNLLTINGILYMEIPNAFNYKMIMRDGHYGLFGITLLDPEDALLYYKYNFKDSNYTVGKYLDFYAYANLFKSHGFNYTLLNEIPLDTQVLEGIVNSIYSLSNSYEDFKNVIPEYLRETIRGSIYKYIENFSRSYERFLENDRSVTFMQLYCYYGIEFWRFLLKKN